MSSRIDKDKIYTLEEWKTLVLSSWPKANLVQEDGEGKTYGDVGEWTAVIGPDFQADVVGVFTLGGYCSIWLINREGEGDFIDLTCDGNVGV